MSSYMSDEQFAIDQKAKRSAMLCEWDSLLSDLFPTGLPQSIVWDQLDDVVEVLQRIVSVSNQLFYPTPACSDLRRVTDSREDDCIELQLDSRTYIVQPVSLKFQNTGLNEWSYFRLQTRALPATGTYSDAAVSDQETARYEDLIDANGRYSVFEDDGEGNQRCDEYGIEIPLPPNGRVVIRCLRDGDYVIFSKGSYFSWELSQPQRINADRTPEDFHNFILAEVQKRNHRL